MIDPMLPDDDVAALPDDVVGTVVPESFESFYGREVRSLVGLAYMLSGSRTAADDLAQEGLLSAYRHWDRVSRYENPGGWVRRVVANRSVSVARRTLSEGRALVRLGGQRTVVPELSPESEELWSAVRHLPPRQAQVIALHFWNGLGTAEIAALLELSEGTVKTHLQRARQSLAVTLHVDTTGED
jgi:RNA polymerase sigma-70 factor (ECF subfamily)